MSLRARLPVACAVVTLALMFAAPTPALALGDWILIEGSMWRQGLEGNASINGDVLGGTTFDFQDTLGFDESDDTLSGRVRFKFSKIRLVFDYFSTERSGDTTLTQSFVFDDTVYTAGQNLQSDMDFKAYQGLFLFSIADLKVVDFGIGIGANQAKFKFDLEGSVSGPATLDESIPYPTAAAYVLIKPIPALRFRAEVNGVRGDVSGTEIDLLDMRAQVEFYLAHVLGFFAGYRQYRIDLTDEDFGSVHFDATGPYAGIGLRF